jgi:Na+-transporting NADH:ubiquinone oxidoreductase subunit B
MTLLKAGQWTPTASDVWGKLFLGRVSGSMGATSALLALIGGLYLLRTHTANRSLVVTTIVSYGALSQVLHWLGVAHVPSALPALFGSGFLFGAFFMVTDPVTSPRTGPGRTIYAVLVAVCAVVIGNFSIFNSGMMFGILLGNTFAPIIDHGVRVWAEVRRARARASAGEGGKADA